LADRDNSISTAYDSSIAELVSCGSVGASENGAHGAKRGGRDPAAGDNFAR